MDGDRLSHSIASSAVPSRTNEAKEEPEAAGVPSVMGISPDFQLDECENGQAISPSLPEPSKAERLNEDPKTTAGDDGVDVSSGNTVEDNESKRCTSSIQKKYIMWAVLVLLVFCTGVALITTRTGTDATTQTKKLPPAVEADEEVNPDDGKTDPTVITSLASAPTATTTQVPISPRRTAEPFLQLQGFFDFVSQINTPPSRTQLPPPTRAPVSPPTRAPVNPPTRAPVTPPTRAPVTPSTPAPTPRVPQWKDFKGILINVGSSRTQNDSRGNKWVRDVGGDVRSTGTIVGSNNCTRIISNTAIDNNLFCTGRVAEPQIRVQKIPRGSYVVTFHFTYPTNVRKEFEVTINNIRVYKELPALPIEPFTAQSVDARVEVSHGFLQVDFLGLQGEPYITAIEVHKANSQFGAPKTNLAYIPGLLTVKESGLILSEGLTAREIATTDERVIYVNGSTSFEKFHEEPDAGATFVDTRPGNQGGWIYVSNSEVEPDGGVGAITFNRHGDVIGYRRLLSNTRDNCGGGRTPWNTWISCEETSDGRIYQVDPLGIREPERITMGETDSGEFESFAYDVRNKAAPRFFATKDDDRGELRRL